MSYITVIIPTRNRAIYLNKALLALSKQSIPADEIIIADNASTDNTKEIVKKYVPKLPLRYLYINKIGVTYTRNIAIKKSKHEIIALLDDDCVPVHNYIENIHKNKKYLTDYVIQGKTVNMTPKNIVSEVVFFSSEYGIRIEVQEAIKKSHYLDSNPIISHVDTKNFIFHRSILKKIGTPFKHTFAEIHCGEDTELGFRLKKNNILSVYISEITVGHFFVSSPKAAILRAISSGKRNVLFQKKIRQIHKKEFKTLDKAKKIFGEDTIKGHNGIQKAEIQKINQKTIKILMKKYSSVQKFQFYCFYFIFHYTQHSIAYIYSVLEKQPVTARIK